MKVAVIGSSGQLGNDLCKELSSIAVARQADLTEAKHVLDMSVEAIRKVLDDPVLLAEVDRQITRVSQNLVNVASKLSESLVALTHQEIEITDLNSVRQALEKHRPDVVINTAAFLRADDCEEDPDRAFSVNALGARNVAVVAEQIGAKLVYISTDFVFGGETEPRTTPYTEFDTPIPPNVYGKSKLAGENFVRHLCRRHFIVRTSGLFGFAASSGKRGNFVDTMVKLARERDKLRVINDQIFSPTYTRDLAAKIAQLVATDYYGIFHITNRGSCSWYEFAKEILRLAGLSTPVLPVTSDEYPQKARRPRFSVLDNYHLRLLGMDDMRTWQEALADYLRSKGHIG